VTEQIEKFIDKTKKKTKQEILHEKIAEKKKRRSLEGWGCEDCGLKGTPECPQYPTVDDDLLLKCVKYEKPRKWWERE